MIRAIIVDDEAPARSELRFLLDETGEVETIGEAANVREALERLKERGGDVMFLDISMPGINGIDLAEALQQMTYPPAIVFVTAYSEHAARAFDVNAIDYLLKPVEMDRLLKAINKVKHYLVSCSKEEHVERIPVEKNGKKMLVAADMVSYLMAKDDYVHVYAGDECYMSNVSLASLEERLVQFGFFRAHRRYLVNLSQVQSITPAGGGTMTLKLRNTNDEVPVSRRRVPEIKKLLNL
ncbi:MAG: response regulator [Coriobacteriales bacterium]|jgi:two-component system response regulator LytT|nr:response regulator [Coriobacteriales bacterium]